MYYLCSSVLKFGTVFFMKGNDLCYSRPFAVANSLRGTGIL